jgi:hypothetical protein
MPIIHNLIISKLRTRGDQRETFLTSPHSQKIEPIIEPISLNARYLLDIREAHDLSHLDLNDHSQFLPISLGSYIKITAKKLFRCVSCYEGVKKIWGGFCYKCLKSKAMADLCILNPHKCHYAQGTCREPSFGQDFCYKPHYVYLSYTDKFKVGITRVEQIPTRWMDQGATFGYLLAKVSSRHQSGVIEHFLKSHFTDRTHWLKMLQNQNERPQSYVEEVRSIFELLKKEWENSSSPLLLSPPHDLSHLGPTKVEFLENGVPTYVTYPILQMPSKVKSMDLEKVPIVEGRLVAIKGQYLCFEDGYVLNMRKHEGFMVDFEIHEPHDLSHEA